MSYGYRPRKKGGSQQSELTWKTWGVYTSKEKHISNDGVVTHSVKKTETE